jgi:exosortase
MHPKHKLAIAITFLIVSFAVLFRGVVASLVHHWYTDDNYSHGFLIVPLALYLVWERRDRLSRLTPAPALISGGIMVLGSVLVLVAGLLGAELFLTRIAIIGVLIGAVLFVLGWPHLNMLAFPLAVLLLMIPIPAILFNHIVFPLQLLASRVGEISLAAAGIPVLREGNIIMLANTTLEVAEACSGIRSLVSLLTLGIIYGYFTDTRTSIRVLVALSAIPVAIFANGLRVAGTGIAAHYYGSAAAEGFFHTFSGWFVFIAAFAMLFGVIRLLLWVAPARMVPSERATAA